MKDTIMASQANANGPIQTQLFPVKSNLKKPIDTEPFISNVYKPVPEVFMCFPKEEFFDFEMNAQKTKSKEYFMPTDEIAAHRKKHRQNRADGKLASVRTQNMKEIQERRIQGLKSYKFVDLTRQETQRKLFSKVRASQQRSTRKMDLLDAEKQMPHDLSGMKKQVDDVEDGVEFDDNEAAQINSAKPKAVK